MTMQIPIGRVLTGADAQRTMQALGSPGISRAFGDEAVLDNVQGGINPFVNEVMRGYPRPVLTPGQVLFRRVTAPTVTFQYKKFGRERFHRQETRRGMNAPFRYKKRTYERVTETLERRGFVSLADRDEVANAQASMSGFANDFEIRKAVEARDEVENDLELVRAGLVTAAGSYGLTPTTLGSGSEFNHASGGSRAPVQAAAWALSQANNIQPMQVGVMLTHKSLQAAQSDPKLIAALAAGSGSSQSQAFGRTPTLSDLASYWGVGEVVAADFFYTTGVGSSFTSAYGDIAVLYILRDRMSGEGSEETSNDAVCDFSWNLSGGLALEPVYKGVEVEGVATSWLFPWEDWTTPRLVNPDAWFLIINTST